MSISDPGSSSPAESAASRPDKMQFSADGRWWWDGSSWRPALSADGHWRWTGAAWIPAAERAIPTRPRPSGGSFKRSTASLVALLSLGLVATGAIALIALAQSDPISFFLRYEGAVVIGLAAASGKIRGWRWALIFLGLAACEIMLIVAVRLVLAMVQLP